MSGGGGLVSIGGSEEDFTNDIVSSVTSVADDLANSMEASAPLPYSESGDAKSSLDTDLVCQGH